MVGFALAGFRLNAFRGPKQTHSVATAPIPSFNPDPTSSPANPNCSAPSPNRTPHRSLDRPAHASPSPKNILAVSGPESPLPASQLSWGCCAQNAVSTSTTAPIAFAIDLLPLPNESDRRASCGIHICRNSKCGPLRFQHHCQRPSWSKSASAKPSGCF